VLSDLVTRHTDCQVTEEFLKVNGGAYEFVCCLIKPGEEGGGEGEGKEEGESTEEEE
jgi:hypothetical protein